MRRLLGGAGAALCLHQRSSRLFQLTPQLTDQQLLLATQRHLTLGVPRCPPQILAATLTRYVLTLNRLQVPVTQFMLLTARQQRAAGVFEAPEFFVHAWTRLTSLLTGGVLCQLLLLLLQLLPISCQRHHLTAE